MDHGGKFGVAETGKSTGHTGNHKGYHQAGAGKLRRGTAGEHENTGTDNGPDTQHDQVGGR